MDEDGLPFQEGRAGERFCVRALTLAPGCSHPYAAAEWKGALVVVSEGEVELETRAGACWRFHAGDVLWLEGLALKALKSPGPADTLLIAVSRRRP
jgi:quercetin dioxygenase-like cupin family protein